MDALADAHGVEREELVDHLYVHAGEDVARHLCRVAPGSTRSCSARPRSWARCARRTTAGTDAGPALDAALPDGDHGRPARARSETAIGANPATASSMALALADGVLGDLRERHALVVGAGRIGLQTLKAVTGRGVANVAVANRTSEHAAEAAERFGGSAYALENLEHALAWADLVVTATSAEAPVLRADVVRWR